MKYQVPELEQIKVRLYPEAIDARFQILRCRKSA